MPMLEGDVKIHLGDKLAGRIDFENRTLYPDEVDNMKQRHTDDPNHQHTDVPGMSPGGDESQVTPVQVTIMGKTFNKVVLIAHSNIFLYAACFWIQIGTLPYLSKKLGADPIVFGYLQTTFAVVQLCGGPLYGRFGDLYGGRAALTLAFLSASLSYGLLAISVNIPLLFLSRLPSVFMHAMQGGQMVVTDMSASGERADALGKLGISYGVGMVVGPVIGGLLTTHMGEQTAAFVACLGSLASVAICMYSVPKVTKRVEAKEEKTTGQIFSMSKIYTLVKNPRAFLLLVVKAVSGVPIGIFQSMFAVIAMDTFKLPADQNGYIMSYIGILSMITQGLGIGFLTKKYSEMTVIKLGAFILIFAYLLLAFITSVFELCLVLIPMCMGLTLINVVISSALTNCVSDGDTGTILGINMAVNSLIRTVSPTIGGIMLESYGFPSFGYLGCVNSALVTAFLVLRT